MITTFIFSFLIVLAAFAAMALGLLLDGREIRGSCGGVAGGRCELCGNDRDAGNAIDTQEKPID